MGKNKLTLLLKFVFTLVLISCLYPVSAQTTSKYLILFKDKANSPYSVSRPLEFLSQRSVDRRSKQNITLTERDLPPNPEYIEAVRDKGATLWYKTRWSNGILVECTPDQLADIETLSFVKGHEANISLSVVPGTSTIKSSGKAVGHTPIETVPAYQPKETLNYGYSQTQIGQMRVDSMHAHGYHGEGMWVAVIDNGFLGVNTQAAFKHLFDENRILGTYDFARNKINVYDQGTHGNSVLSCMAAYLPGQLIGTAFKASYLLLHSEENSSEKRQEEAFWLAAAEYADSVGVDVINSSLGYTTFDNSATNYTYNDLTGKVALSSRAATWAAQAGILVVVAAGNEGSDSWKYLSVPADADSVISVGAVDSKFIKAGFSSFGPTADGRMKPDLAALGSGAVLIDAQTGNISAGSGTSFASPLLAGMATCFWQAYPDLTNMDVITMLKRSGTQASNPDNLQGYGVPNYLKAVQAVETLRSGTIRLIPNPTKTSQNPYVEIPFGAPTRVYSVTLLDTRGRIFWEGQISGNRAEIPVGNLPIPTGTYILQFKRDTESYSAHWLKM
ncbi:MAG: S8 family serine peptidase [Siphonobacter sp.]